MRLRSVRVDIRSEVLRRVFEDQLKDFPGLTIDGCRRPDVVLSTTADCSPLESGQLAESGAEVVVFATIPNDDQRRIYEDAGARYVPMSGNSAGLLAVLQGLQVAD